MAEGSKPLEKVRVRDSEVLPRSPDMCLGVTVLGLPLGAPHGRMGHVHSSLCNTIKQKIHVSLRTPVHMRIYRDASMRLPKTGVGKTQLDVTYLLF